jgi:GntR family transcriptional regulator/MocR family aminotransferase
MSLYIISQLLIRPKDVVLVGDLSHYAQYDFSMRHYQNNLDEQGLDVDILKPVL